jgi:hypothetical protein
MFAVASVILGAGCAGPPGGPAEPEAPRPSSVEPDEGGSPQGGGVAIHLGDLGWTTATASTYQFPTPGPIDPSRKES